MATLYNGKEIKSTSKLSGLSLVGKSSIDIGGRTISLSPSIEYFKSSFGLVGRPRGGHEESCAIGPTAESFFLYSETDLSSGIELGYIFNSDDKGTKFDGSNLYYYNFDLNLSVIIDSTGTVTDVFRCR